MADTDRPTRRYKSPSELSRQPPPQPSPPARHTGPHTTTARTTTTTTTSSPTNNLRNTPYLPTPSELALLALYPSILLFGALFSLLSPKPARRPTTTPARPTCRTRRWRRRISRARIIC
ncbi:hypothetical protein B0I37DRAFT_239555 [Chaetomium sp. MPI-CAGE-AT-0009]|nr:hypothetical protein B0I37DRAFT_239555 [Chaetomium sp. MPI-CAGE-AT-0009]